MLILIPCCFALFASAAARNFTLRDELVGQDFFSAFQWWSYGDPTGGSVDYVTRTTAQRNNLSFVNERGNFVIQADSTTVVPSGQQRQSVRLHSAKTMGDGILVARFAWMPQGCGTWPAFWTCTTSRWPAGGEIDIIEGANDQGPRNLASLHTTYGCHIEGGTTQQHTGVTDQTDCSYQPGCSVRFTGDNSFGPNFNRNGGGWFAMRRDTRIGGDGIGVWFWPSTTPVDSLPAAVASAAGAAPAYVVTNRNATGSDKDQLSKWGTPAAFFPNVANYTATPQALAGGNDPVCEMENYFDEHEIIINLTLCGYWAGETFANSGCAAQYGNLSCEEFVRRNPAAFKDARWEIEYMRTYTDAGYRVGSVGTFGLAVMAAITALLIDRLA